MEIVHITRTAKVCHPVNERQSAREHERLSKRTRFCGPELDRVEAVLERAFGRVTMAVLQTLAANCVALTNGALKPDRLARRHRPAMLCFFCENWPAISHLMTQNNLMAPQLAADIGEPDPLSISALLNRDPG
jgi:hypothetical protein